MKRIYHVLVLLLCIPLFSSCELYCIWLISELDGINLGGYDGIDKELYFDKDGGEDLIQFKEDYKFYLVRVQGDTIYWYANDSYKQKSIANGYTFESNDYFITGHGLTLDATYADNIKVKLEKNTSDGTRYISFVAAPHDYQLEEPFRDFKYIELTQWAF